MLGDDRLFSLFETRDKSYLIREHDQDSMASAVHLNAFCKHSTLCPIVK